MLFTITGRLGSAAVVPPDFIGNINQHSVRIKLDEKKINSAYASAFLNTEFMNHFYTRCATGGTRQALDYGSIRELKIPLPPVQKQKEIADQINEILDETEKKKIESNEILKSAKSKVEKMILVGE